MTTPAKGPLGRGAPRADVERVVEVLHTGGPCPYSTLRRQAEAAGWDPQRLEDAVVVAWADGLIFFDSRDEVVAL